MSGVSRRAGLEFSAAVEDYVRDVGDTRYARMLDQLRRQCAPATQTASPR
jgi:hypothetical protein